MSDERIPIDQLLDLVEGRLPDEEAARLQAALDSRDRRELAVQAAVRTVLGQLPDPVLSDGERQRLRAAVRAELRVEEAHPAPSEGRQGRRSWLVRAIPSAAAAASVVAMIAVAINLIGDADSGQEAAPTETRTVVAEDAGLVEAAAPAPTEEVSAADVLESGVAEESENTAQAVAEAAPTEADMAMDETLTAQAPEAEMAATEAEKPAGLGPGYVAFEVATGQPEEAREMLEVLETLAAVTEMAPVPVTELAARAGEEGLVCWLEAAALAGASGVITWMAPGIVDGIAGEAYLVAPRPDDQPGAGVLALFVYPDCQAVALRAVTAEAR